MDLADIFLVLNRFLRGTACAIAVYIIVNEVIRYWARNPSFAGPRGLPILGNLRQLNVNAPEVLRQWSKVYGEVYRIQFGNIPILVVNSAAAAKELFAHHSHALNSRPVFYTFHKIVAKTSGATIGTSPISPILKTRRRAAAAALNKPAVSSYAPHLDLETKALVEDLFVAGQAGKKAINPIPLVRRFALSIILTVNWGTRITSADKALFDEITEVEAGIVSTRRTTENLQDYIPLLRLNPFSARSRKAEDWRGRREVYLQRLDDELRERMKAGTHKPCIQSNAIQDPEAKLTEADLRTISISMIQGGTGTISGTISWSLAFLSQHPDIQTKAFKEISTLFPTPASLLSASTAANTDFEKQLPYLHALARECLRYFTVLRLSLPRSTTSPITYQGRLIPSGTTIFLNAWSCNLDPAIWPSHDPEQFIPERWLAQPDTPLFTYGLGYRMCAGSALANRELELVFLRVLGCFVIEAVEGREADANPWTGSSNVKEGGQFPRAYEVVFRVRDERGLREALGKQEEGKTG